MPFAQEPEIEPRPCNVIKQTALRSQFATASGEYLEIEQPRRLVYTFAMLQFSPNSDTITLEIEPEGNSSVITFTQAGVDIANELREIPPGQKGASEQGWNQGFDSLAAALRYTTQRHSLPCRLTLMRPPFVRMSLANPGWKLAWEGLCCRDGHLLDD